MSPKHIKAGGNGFTWRIRMYLLRGIFPQSTEMDNPVFLVRIVSIPSSLSIKDIGLQAKMKEYSFFLWQRLSPFPCHQTVEELTFLLGLCLCVTVKGSSGETGRAAEVCGSQDAQAPGSTLFLAGWIMFSEQCHSQHILSACVCVCAHAQLLSHVWLFVTPWTVAHWALLSMGFSRQEYWSGLPCPPPGDLPNSGIEPTSPSLEGGFFTTEPPGKPQLYSNRVLILDFKIGLFLK